MKRELYIYEILRCLDRKGSAQLDSTVYDEVLHAVRANLTDWDFALVPSEGEERWRNHIRQASRTMIEHGLMKRPIHNTWDITDEGRKYLRAYPNVNLWKGGITYYNVDEEW